MGRTGCFLFSCLLCLLQHLKKKSIVYHVSVHLGLQQPFVKPVASFSSCCLCHLRGRCVVSRKQIWPAGSADQCLSRIVIPCVASVTATISKHGLTRRLRPIFGRDFSPGCASFLYKNRLGEIFSVQIKKLCGTNN